MKNQADKTASAGKQLFRRMAAWMLTLGLSGSFLGLSGCATAPAALTIKDLDQSFGVDSILSGETGRSVSIEMLVADLARARVVYVGETHINPAHHRIQRQLMALLHQRHPRLTVGMEMFDRTYQAVLDQWSAGALDEDAFLQKTQWYANWRFPYPLYRDLLDFIRAQGLPLFALNLPGHIPARIRVGGIANLTPYDSPWLPAEIDLTHEAHRRYLESVFQRHAFRGDASFEFFYEAQCVWEETMAESIARSLTAAPMLVLAGNSHIQFHYGIPERALRRTGVPFRTVYLATVGETVPLGIADYIWVTPAPGSPPQ
jgi:uncharacterized iron-regulated protein